MQSSTPIWYVNLMRLYLIHGHNNSLVVKWQTSNSTARHGPSWYSTLHVYKIVIYPIVPPCVLPGAWARGRSNVTQFCPPQNPAINSHRRKQNQMDQCLIPFCWFSSRVFTLTSLKPIWKSIREKLLKPLRKIIFYEGSRTKKIFKPLNIERGIIEWFVL